MLAPGTFDDRVAVVTGGGSGIGLAIAGELARLGASVALLGRTEQTLRDAAGGLAERGAEVSVHAVDVRDRDGVDAALHDVVDRHGRLDHLVNSAAGNFRVPPEEMSAGAWDAVVQIVEYGTWHCTQLAGRYWLEQGIAGSVLNIGSTMAQDGGPDTVHSASAKAAVETMTRSLAVAWGPHGIRLNVLVPGSTEGTAGLAALHTTPGEDVDPAAIVPLRRLGTRQELAEAASYLLSDHASYITGARLVMDGGRSLGRL